MYFYIETSMFIWCSQMHLSRTVKRKYKISKICHVHNQLSWAMPLNMNILVETSENWVKQSKGTSLVPSVSANELSSPLFLFTLSWSQPDDSRSQPRRQEVAEPALGCGEPDRAGLAPVRLRHGGLQGEQWAFCPSSVSFRGTNS